MIIKKKIMIYKVMTIIFLMTLYFVSIGIVTKGIFLMRESDLINPDNESFFPIAVKKSSGIEIKNLIDVVQQESYVLACENTLKMRCTQGKENISYTTYSLDYFDGDYRYEVQYISVGNKVYPVSKKTASVADMLTAALYVTSIFALVAIIVLVCRMMVIRS